MSENFTQQMKLTAHDLNCWGRIRPISLARFMEDTAVAAAAAAGFNAAWYKGHKSGWFMRNLTLQQIGSVTGSELLTVSTWVSNIGRLRLDTEYEIHRPDGAPVAVGRAERVYMDLVRLRPQALDPAMTAAWSAQVPSNLWRDLDTPMVPLSEPSATHTQQAYLYDTDYLGHVNNTVYLNWLEESAREALHEALPQDPAPNGYRIALQKIAITYLVPTRPGEVVTITTRPVQGTEAGDLVQLNQELLGSDGTLRVRAETMYKRSLGES